MTCMQLPPSPSKKKSIPGSAWTYLASWRWVKPMSILAVLYSLSLLFLLNLFWKLPSTDTLSAQPDVEGKTAAVACSAAA